MSPLFLKELVLIFFSLGEGGILAMEPMALHMLGQVLPCAASADLVLIFKVLAQSTLC
jgi:hypothetical protein